MLIAMDIYLDITIIMRHECFQNEYYNSGENMKLMLFTCIYAYSDGFVFRYHHHYAL